MKLGFLQLCADRRFHRRVMRAFEAAAGLGPEDYWIEATAGGAAGVGSSKTADYAYKHGARFLGWCCHGDNCGGFPGASDEEMQKKLDEVVQRRVERYFEATHFRIFVTEKELKIERVKA